MFLRQLLDIGNRSAKRPKPVLRYRDEYEILMTDSPIEAKQMRRVLT
jgi:hypothetical protein